MPLKDYHWYRQNSDGTWSHKPGSNEVTNLDGNDEVIKDPMLCNRQNPNIANLNYTTFIGFYAVTPWNGVNY